MLDRKLAEKSHFPAIDVSRSISRVFRDVAKPDQQVAALRIRNLMATYDEMADLIRIGAYEVGSSPEVDLAIKLMPVVNAVLRQEAGTHTPLPETIMAMTQVADAWQVATKN